MNERFVRAGAIARVDLAHERDFALGRVEIRPTRREIVGEGLRENVEPMVMRVLVALARSTGEILSRDDLIESCWNGVIVGEDAINRCISQLRKAAEASGSAFSIETIPRVGYRLKVAAGPRASSPASPTATKVAEAARPRRSEASALLRAVGPKWIAVLSAALLLILVAAGFALWRSWPATPVRIPAAPVEASVAVLRFVNMSGDPKENYFSDGFTEELINRLANEPHLNVASRTSSFAFKGRNENIATIARALNVHAIVEGSVRESGDRVRITAQLIDAGSGYHLWSADYTRNLTDILSLQDTFARAVAAALTHVLVPAPATPRPKIDPAVYRLFLEGIHQFQMPVPQGWRRALAIFSKVTERAPRFADGFVWLAVTAEDLAGNFDAAPASGFAVAGEAAERALALDPHNARARAARAMAALATWDWRGVASDLRILKRQNPDDDSTVIGLWNYYTFLGFPDQALTEWRRMSTLDPPRYEDSWVTLEVLYANGRYREETRVAQAQLVHRPRDTFRLAHLCAGYAAAGAIAEARATLERLRGLQADRDSAFDFQECEMVIDEATRNHTEALKLVRTWASDYPDKFHQPAYIGFSYMVFGDFDRASRWFARAYDARKPLFFTYFGRWGPFGRQRAKYRATDSYKALAAKPLFREWQAERDRVAAALAAHKDPLR